ncbi:hypothetical protein RUM43_006752 [Polyplax serrata]|uniref:Uncharacterized protein n=1 Tax=Polyplax serrata TaxID=468196 RepID=A0AAN8P4K9_POLSC
MEVGGARYNLGSPKYSEKSRTGNLQIKPDFDGRSVGKVAVRCQDAPVKREHAEGISQVH